MTDIGWTQEEIDQYNNEGYAKLAEEYKRERDALADALRTARDMVRHIPDPHAAATIRSEIDEALAELEE